MIRDDRLTDVEFQELYLWYTVKVASIFDLFIQEKFSNKV